MLFAGKGDMCARIPAANAKKCPAAQRRDFSGKRRDVSSGSFACGAAPPAGVRIGAQRLRKKKDFYESYHCILTFALHEPKI